jgi:ParE toxin of type II toxin-antitoxin system, parDE
LSAAKPKRATGAKRARPARKGAPALPPTVDAGRPAARVSANFRRNLENIRAYLEEQQADGLFESLIDDLFVTVIPNLERFPDLGFDLLARKPGSIEGVAKVLALRKRIGHRASIREYVSGEYLVLYVADGEQITLLAIKHHLQLSFDLRGHWAR